MNCRCAEESRELLPNILLMVILSVGWSTINTSNLYGQYSKSPVIRAIQIDRREVFDLQDSTERDPFGLFANKFHILTKEHVIRNELLFHELDSLDLAAIEETERNLRKMGIIGDVAIRTRSASADSVDLVVETHDKWTLNTNPSFKQDGGIQNYSLTMSEDNLLGNNQKLSAGINYNTARTKPYGVEFILSEPRLLGSRWKSTVQYKSSEELNIGTFLLERQFFAERARWSAGLYADEGTSQIRTYENGTVIQRRDLRQENRQMWLVTSFGEPVHWRAGIAFLRLRSQSDSLSLRSFDNFDLFNLSFGVFRRDFFKESYLDNFGRVEDISEGYSFNVVFGKNVLDSPLAKSRYFFILKESYASRLGATYLGQDISYSSFLLRDGMSEASLSWNFVGYSRLTSRQTLVARCTGVLGFNWSPGRQITLGAPSGLRGYDAFQFSGERALVVNVEDRVFPDVNLWIFRLGGAFFFDAGTVWDKSKPFSDARFHSAVGFGVRIENTKQQGPGVVRIDFAFNLDEHRFKTLTITSGLLFDAFTKIDYTPPHLIQ